MITKIHFKLEILSFYFKKNFPFLILGLLLGSGLYFFRQPIIGFVASHQLKTGYIGISGLFTPKNLPEEISSLISFGLTINSENDKATISPLVSSYSTQNDNQEYIFNLNPDILWHSGKKFTSSDIDYQFSGMKFTQPSPQTIKINLDKAFSPIFSLLSKPIIGNNYDGLGSYRVKKILLREGYVKTVSLQSNLPDSPNLIYKFYPNDTDLIHAFQLGEVDEIKTTQLPANIDNWTKVKITPQIQSNQRYLAIFFNTEQIGEKQIRQSLAYATPKTRDRNERCLGPISANSWAYNPQIKEYNYNPTRAKELFEKNPVDQIKLSILNRDLLPQAEAIKDSWQKILNIKVEISIENQLDSQNYQAVLAYGGIPHDPDQYPFWHSTQNKTNLTHLNNSRIDKLLEEGRQITDPIERKKIYYDFQRYLLEESPAIFLSYPTVYTITRTK